MSEESLDEEFSIMYTEPERSHLLDSDAFRMPVRNLKVRKPVMIEVGQSVREALTIMQLKQFGCLLVTKGTDLAGILTERDIIAKALGEDRDLSEIPVEEIMTPDPESFQAEDCIAYIMNAMHNGGYRHVPIVDDRNRPIAVVSVKDIVGFIVERFPEEILNLPPTPVRSTNTQDGG